VALGLAGPSGVALASPWRREEMVVGHSCEVGIRSVHLVGKGVGQGVLLEVPEDVQGSCWHVDPSEVALGQGRDLVPEGRLVKARSGVLR
jgi:hypothetical protein